MKKLGWIVPVVALAGCGDAGLRASGSVHLVVRQSGQPDGSADFLPPGETSIDPPPGAGRGVYGTCRRSGNQWGLTLTRADASPEGLRSFTVNALAGGAMGSSSLSFTLGSSVFAATGTCAVSATPAGDDPADVKIQASCTGLRATNDPRTVDATVTLTVRGCTVP